jgi:hypothetical protein
MLPLTREGTARKGFDGYHAAEGTADGDAYVDASDMRDQSSAPARF